MILRNKHESNFTTLSNSTLSDKVVSFKARGLLAFMLSKPNDWKFYTTDIKNNSDIDGMTSISSGIRELIKAGYVTKSQTQDESGKWSECVWDVRETPHSENPQTVLPNTQKRALLSTDRRLNTDKNKEVPKKEVFDATALTLNLSKYPAVVKAWNEFVQHRKELGHKMTPGSWKKMMQKMVNRSPNEIVAAINMSIENDWRGIFFRDFQMKTQRELHRPEVKLDPQEYKMYTMLKSVLGQASTAEAKDHSDAVKEFYRNIPCAPYGKNLGPKERISFETFWDRWLCFLDEKNRRGFRLQSSRQIAIGGVRWNEFIADCERYTNYSFKTGEYLG